MRLSKKTQYAAGVVGLVLMAGVTSGCSSSNAATEDGYASRIESAATKAETAANRAADAAAKASAAADRAEAAAQKAEAKFPHKLRK